MTLIDELSTAIPLTTRLHVAFRVSVNDRANQHWTFNDDTFSSCWRREENEAADRALDKTIRWQAGLLLSAYRYRPGFKVTHLEATALTWEDPEGRWHVGNLESHFTTNDFTTLLCCQYGHQGT